MVNKPNPVGGRAAWEMLAGEIETRKWVRSIVQNRGFFLIAFALLVIWLPSKGIDTGVPVLLWSVVYCIYLLGIETLFRRAHTGHLHAGQLYEANLFRLFRVHFNLAMIAILVLISPSAASSYLWFFFSMPLLATIAYFGNFPLLIALAYLEVCTVMLFLTLAQDSTTFLTLATMAAKDAILGLMTGVLYFFLHLSPRVRELVTLQEGAQAPIQVLDRDELSRVLADAAKVGVHRSEAAVVHLLEGEDNRTLIPRGSSHIDLTVLGRSLMKAGEGIAGHAIENRKMVNVPDLYKDKRYHQLPESFVPFASLLVAPMYVGDKNVGTISVHSRKKRAFDTQDERFLTVLAAQGAAAIANAELYGSRSRQRQQIAKVLEASLTFGLGQPRKALLEAIAEAACHCCGYGTAIVGLLDKETNQVIATGMAGVPDEDRQRLEGKEVSLETLGPLLQDEFCISRSYFIRHDRRPKHIDLGPYAFRPDLSERQPGEWHQEDRLIVTITTQKGELLGYIFVSNPEDRQLPSLDTVWVLEILASVAAAAIQNVYLFEQAQEEIAQRKQAERALVHERDLLQTLMDNIPDTIYFKDAASRFTRINRAHAHVFGLNDPQDAVGQTDFDFFDAEYAREAYADEQKIVESGRPLIGKIEELKRKNGVARWVSATKVPIMGIDGQVTGIVGVSRDITERKRMEEELAREQHLWQTFIDNVPYNIYFKDTESRFIKINRARADWFGLSDPSQAVSKTDFDFFTDEHAQQAYDDEQEVMRTQQPLLSKEEKETWLDGRVTWAITTKMPLYDEVGNVVGTFGISGDITQRRQTQEELRQRHQELALLNQLGQALSSTLDLGQVLMVVLNEVCRLLKVTAASVWLIEPGTGNLVCQQATGPRNEIVRGSRLQPGEGLASWTISNGKSLVVPDTRFDERHFKDVDERTGMEMRSTLIIPLRVKEDVIGVLQVADTEVARFKKADLDFLEPLAANAAIAIANARLYEETDRLRAFNQNIVQGMEEGIIIEDEMNWITFVNPKTIQLLGYSSEELIGQPCLITIAPEERETVEQENAKRRQGIANQYETVMLAKDGRRVPVLASAKPIEEGGAFKGILAVYTDITDTKQRETRLREYVSRVTNQIARYTSLEGLCEYVVDAGAGLLSARECSVFLASEEDDETLRLVATTRPLDDGDTQVIHITGSHCRLVAHAAQTCRPIRLTGNEIKQHPSWNEDLWQQLGWDSKSESNHSLLMAPMRLPDGRPVGILVARETDRQGGFSEFDEELLNTLAINTTIGIQRVRDLDRVRDEAIRAERKRLEADLHDAINMLATGVRWEAEILSDEIKCGNLDKALHALTRLQAARTRTSTDLRYILEDLRNPTLEQEGLLAALKKRADLIGHGCIKVHGDVWESLPSEVGGILYRVGQEAMDNAVKHSGVMQDPSIQIDVRLERSDSHATLCVCDDGLGFNVEEALAWSYKWGLRRLRDTLREMGGKLEINSALGRGTTVCAVVNLAGGSYGG